MARDSVTGYIVCASCGSRIKADREHCLRCGAILETAEAIAARRSLSKGQVLIVATVLSLAVLGTGVVWWETRSRPLDDVAQPFAGATPAAAPPQPSASAASPATPVEVPVARQVESAARDASRVVRAALSSGDLQSAKAGYEQALEAKPDDPEALNGLGLVLERLGDKAGAVVRFSRAAELAPDQWSYRFNLAHAEGELQQWAQAIADYREAARLFPDDYATQYNLALALHKKGDERAAIPEYEKAIQLAPGEPSFHLSLGISLEKVRRINDAVREYRTFLEMAPSTPDAAQVKAHIDELVSARAGNQS